MHDSVTLEDKRTIRVLIADDKPDLRRAFTNLLYFEDDLKIVGTAEDGQDALNKTRALRPDVVLMDIEMPVMDGIVATQRLKGQWPEAVVIAMSSELRHMHHAIAAGAAAFLVKPFTCEEVTNAIYKAVRFP